MCKAAFAEKLLLIPAGPHATVRVLPPLNVSATEVEEGLGKLAAALASVFPDACPPR